MAPIRVILRASQLLEPIGKETYVWGKKMHPGDQLLWICVKSRSVYFVCLGMKNRAGLTGPVTRKFSWSWVLKSNNSSPPRCFLAQWPGKEWKETSLHVVCKAHGFWVGCPSSLLTRIWKMRSFAFVWSPMCVRTAKVNFTWTSFVAPGPLGVNMSWLILGSKNHKAQKLDC